MTSDESYSFAKKQVLRAFYDCIDAHEKRGLKTIDINWLRDYIDDIAVYFPEQAPEVSND
jgi:hypothetical protein